MKKNNILFIVGSMDIGGVQSGIMNFAEIAPAEQAHFDIFVHSSKIGYHEHNFKKFGNIFHIKTLKTKYRIFIPFILILNNFLIKNGLKKHLKKCPNYTVIHSKSLEYSAAAVEVAKKYNIPVRIAQSHVDKPDRLNIFSRWYYSWCAKRIEKNATVKLAVSEKAADLMFGKFGGQVIKNPTINLTRLNPSEYPSQPHDEIRLIHIGTYSKRKNQCFSVDILKGLINQNIKSKLTFVGYTFDDLTYQNTLKSKVALEGLNQYVNFLPKDTDIPKILSESDYMLLPSLREGLPNVALEAQAMGVPCFLSDTITKATDCGLCIYLSLNTHSDLWAKKIFEYRENHGTEKKFINMTEWDNKNIVQKYINIWSTGHVN